MGGREGGEKKGRGIEKVTDKSETLTIFKSLENNFYYAKTAGFSFILESFFRQFNHYINVYFASEK